MKNFDNNARTIPVETTSYSYKHLNKDDTLKMRIDVKNAILRLTNIDQKQYEDYDAYFTISGSAANDTIIRILMNKSNESLRNKILTTNVEHLSTMRVAMYFDRNIVDVVNKSYDGHDTKDARFAHFIVANNESGIIYTSMLDYIAKNRGQIPIVSADTIQCLGKTRTIDYNLFDIFTFTSQKLFCEAGISGFIFNTKRVPLADPTMMLSQHLCANLISGVEYLLSGPDPDEYFKDLTTYTFDKIRDVASSKELELLILIDDIGSYVDQKTNEPFDISQDIDDETVIVIVYRDLKEG